MKTPTQNNFRVIIIIKIPVGQSQPTVRQNVSAEVGTLEKKKEKKEASTIHPHHCSKILFQNEDSHSKKKLGRDSSLSL